MQILWLTSNFPPMRGGSANDCVRIVSDLRKSGLRIDVVHFNANAKQLRTLDMENGYNISVPIGDQPEHVLNCLYNYLTDPVNDLFYSHIVAFGGIIPLTAMPIYKNWMGTKSVTMLRDNDFDMSLFSPNNRTILFDAINASNVVCTLSTEAQRRVKRLFPNSHVERICPGIESSEWFCEASDYSAAEVFKEKNKLNNRINIGIFGRMREKKGVAFFLESVLKAGLNDAFNFILAGEIEDKVKNWIAAHKDMLNIVYVPYVDKSQLLQIYPACDFVAVPSHYDGLPNVILESCALGIPVLASRAGGTMEALPEEQRKLTFHPGNSLECQKAIYRAATMTADERSNLSELVRTKVLTDFTATVEIKQYYDLLTRRV